MSNKVLSDRNGFERVPVRPKSTVRRPPLHRRGLAPLELVLALPMLVFIAALMVNFGVAGNWKLRSLTIARQQLWGSRLVPYVILEGHNVVPDYTQPLPAFWQAAAGTAGHGSAGNDASLDQNQIGAGSTVGAVVRGWQVGQFSFSANGENVLDPATGFRNGWSGVSGSYPFFSRWPAYRWSPQNQLLSDPWPSWAPRMTWNDASRQNNPNMAQMGLRNNLDVRVPLIYTEPTAPSDSYVTPRNALYTFYNDPASQLVIQLLESLFPDFNDLSLPRPGASSWPYPYQPNPLGCQTDPATIEALVDAYIKNLPELIKQQIQNDITFYNNQIAADQAALNANPPPPPDQQSQLQQQVSQDQAIVSALQDLLQAFAALP